MKLLLINPSRVYYLKKQEISHSLPLGIMYVAAAVESEIDPIQVSIFDCRISSGTRLEKTSEGFLHHGVSDSFFMDMIAKESPDIVGISCMFTATFSEALQAAKLVKNVFKDIFVVGGGAHFATVGKDFLLDNQCFDCFVSGEGENSMVEIMRVFQQKTALENVSGLTCKTLNSQGQVAIKKCKPQQFQRQLDLIPMPAYHLVDMELFFHFQKQGLRHRGLDIKCRNISMITSRGCPYNCTFCSIALHMGKPVRSHSPEYVVSHIEHVVNKYQVGHVSFEDDAFTFYPQQVKRICDLMVQKGITITWDTPNGVRADTLDLSLLKSMKKAGCNNLSVATESGDQETLDKIIKKNLKLETTIQVAKLCKEVGIPLTSFFVIGFPGENKEKIQKTIDFACMLYEKYDVIMGLNIATPLIGTSLYDVVVKGGFLAKDVNSYNISNATSPIIGEGMIETPEFTPQDLKDFSMQAYAKLRKIKIKKALKDPKKLYQLIKIRVLGMAGRAKLFLWRNQ